MDWETLIKLGIELIQRGCQEAEEEEGYSPCGICPFEKICDGVPKNW